MKNLPYLITTFIIFGLVACNGQTPTVVPSPVIPTLTTHLTIAPTVTPSKTFLVPEPTITMDFAATMVAEATVAASAKVCRKGKLLAGVDIDNWVQSSPGGDWNLINCKSDTNDNNFTKVFRIDGTISWTIPFDDFPWVQVDDPFKRIVSDYWTKDGKYVYLRPIIWPFDPTNHEIFRDALSLYRLNLKTGKLSVVFSKKNNDLSAFTYTISPDEKYLIYVDLENEPNILHISNLKSGELQSLKLDGQYTDTDAFIWTPDNKKLIFVAALSGWENLTISGFTLYSLDINTFSLEIIIDNDTRDLLPCFGDTSDSWKNENTLLVCEFMDGTPWTVNIQSGVIEAENTPTPQP